MTDQDVDISNISDLADVIVGTPEGEYEAPSGFSKPPDSGQYTFIRVNEADSDYSEYEGANDKGPYWGANFKVMLQGGKFDGRIGRMGVNTFPSFDRKGNSAEDFLRASKSTLRPQKLSEFKAAVAKTVGPFDAVTGWEWRCRDCDHTFLVGQFGPKAPKKYTKTGGPAPKVALVTVKIGEKEVKQASHVQNCPTCNQEVGAQMTVKRFVVTGSGAVSGPATKAAETEVAG